MTGRQARFLYRYPSSGRFITTSDPKYSYEYTCGSCGYPVFMSDQRCPRCRKELEACPICTHRRRLIPARPVHCTDKIGVRCSICETVRIPYERHLRIRDLDGRFCSNLYGCGAGGMMIRTGELVLIPEGRELCPVCGSEDRLPLDIGVFEYALEHCLFCSHVFREHEVSRDLKDKKHGDGSPRVSGQIVAADKPDRRCLICERADYRDSEDRLIRRHGDEDAGEGITDDDYRRVLELGMAFANFEDDDVVFDQIFKLWFRQDRSRSVEDLSVIKRAPFTVWAAIEFLIRGTEDGRTRRILEGRADRFGELWKANSPRGLSFPLT